MNQLATIQRELDRQGFTYRLTRGCHLMVYDPTGAAVSTTSTTGGKGRGYRNFISQLRRAGFIWKDR